MKKTFKTFLLMFVCGILTLLTGCSGCSKDKKDLLETVPADTSVLLFFDANEIWKQLEFNVNGDEVSYCKELKEIVTASGIKTSQLDKSIRIVDQTNKSAVFFEYDKEFYISFYVKDGKDFMKMLDEENDMSFDKEDGFQLCEHTAIKGDQVWISMNKDIDTDTLEKFLKLDKDKRFCNKYEKITETITADDISFAALVNLSKLKELVNEQEFSLGLGTLQGVIFEDSEFILATAKITDNNLSFDIRVLDKKGEPAKFNLPMAKIDVNSLGKLNNNAPLIVAGAVDPALTEKIFNIINSFNHSVPDAAEKLFINNLKSIDGTFGLSFSSPEDVIGIVNFSNPDAPAFFGDLILSKRTSKLNVSTAGNTLILRTPGASEQGQGQAPSVLNGQYIGVYTDYGKIQNPKINNYDFSGFGKGWMTFGPDGKGAKLSFTWELKNPLKSLLTEGMKIYRAILSGNFIDPSFYDDCESIIGMNNDKYAEYNDTLGVYDDYNDDYYNYDYYDYPAVMEEPAYLMPAGK